MQILLPPRLSKAVVIGTENAGFHHTEMIRYVLDASSARFSPELGSSPFGPSDVPEMLQDYCRAIGVALPDGIQWHVDVLRNQKHTLSDLLDAPIFSRVQRLLLSESFEGLQLIANDLNRYRELLVHLNLRLIELEETPAGQGQTIARAIVNHLIASTDFWIKERKICRLPLPEGGRPKPAPAAVLAAGATAFGLVLLETETGLAGEDWCLALLIGAEAALFVCA